jgi:hypothetical protein
MTVAEPFLGYPAGTPLSVILDVSTLRFVGDGGAHDATYEVDR